MARFPRDIYPESKVDQEDGHIFMKKLEPWINTYSPALTYLLRCNTDASSMMSGTSIKAVISYVTDYVTKPSLKTHQIFSASYDVFEKNSELIGGTIEEKSAARKLLLKIVNSLTSKMEIGSPMACLYLLGLFDHYTSHIFVPFWWRSYVNEVRRNNVEGETPSTDNKTNNEEDDSDKVVLLRQQENYIGQSNVDDYVHRPSCYNVVNLYQWIQTSNKRRISRKNKHKNDVSTDSEESSDEEPNNDWEDVDLANIKKYQRFMPGHPSHETHEVICNMDKLDNVVPNILGGPMPRSDSGDREFYCMTMLTLFKPWRTGKTLKEEGQT
ncbi:hypothetical protein M413DRAFT_77609, partial [Hebeloma cylindrosporum]